MVALQDLGHEVFGINTSLVKSNFWWLVVRFVSRTSYRLFRMGLGPFPLLDLSSVNEAILSAIQRTEWDVLWIDKGLTVRPGTLKRVKERQPGCRIVGYSPDDMYQRRNQSQEFLQDLVLYDVYFTTKS